MQIGQTTLILVGLLQDIASSLVVLWFLGKLRNKTQYPYLLLKLNTERHLLPPHVNCNGSFIYCLIWEFHVQSHLSCIVIIKAPSTLLPIMFFMNAQNIWILIVISFVRKLSQVSCDCYLFHPPTNLLTCLPKSFLLAYSLLIYPNWSCSKFIHLQLVGGKREEAQCFLNPIHFLNHLSISLASFMLCLL